MQTISDKRSLRELLKATRKAGKSIGLVPTMGNLHAGHLQLVREARSKVDFVVCTIFVNPLQFGPTEDLDAYPRTLVEDIASLNDIDCDLLFMPAVAEIYGDDLHHQTTVNVPDLTDKYCGASRPGHFDGVATIVCKLFNLVQPDCAVFGLKDYQQFLVIRKMTQELEFDLELIGVEIQRDTNGLALSSRNRYLSDAQRQQAGLINRSLLDMAQRIQQGERDFPGLEAQIIKRFNDAGFEVDYLAICNATTLQAASKQERDFVILAAVQVGPSRLLDNVRFTAEP